MQEITKDHQELLDKIPDLETYKNDLALLRNLNLSSFNDKEIEEAFFKYARFLPHFVSKIPKEEFNTNTFYRVRNLKIGTEDISLIRTFSYPIPGYCNFNGRANKAGKSVFYTSDYAIAAMIESKQKDGEIGFLSLWKPKVDRDVQFAIFLPKRIKGNNPWYDEAVQLHDYLSDQNIHLGQHKKAQLDLLNEFVCDQFIYEKSPYSLTSWLCNKMMYGYIGIDFILYPSVETDSHFCNLAFHPNFADKYLEFDKALQFRFEFRKGTKAEYSIGKIGKINQNIIDWTKPTLEEAKIIPGIIEAGIKK